MIGNSRYVCCLFLSHRFLLTPLDACAQYLLQHCSVSNFVESGLIIRTCIACSDVSEERRCHLLPNFIDLTCISQLFPETIMPTDISVRTSSKDTSVSVL